MAFDQTTRNRLQRFVNDARRVLEEEFTRQLQNDYGMDPNAGTVADLASLRHINDAQRETARILRDTLAHYTASGDMNAMQGLDRVVREQAFTVLNRLAALRMAEARGLLVESVGNGFQAKGFQLYARLAGTGLGETGDAYRVYLFSVFDELAQDLPGLFDRYSPQGRLFPREAALLQVLTLINDADVAPLWSEDETIGWIYQYFNSKEERKAMRDASQAPRNSRELAVRNQFFTPRYVVEFLVDNTLGRLWFDATGGVTDLRDRCQYLLVKPDEAPPAATKLRDPRTLKLLDPACGSMHFGLYAFDLFAEVYREAWAWEQQHGPGSLDVSTQPQAALQPLSQTYEDEAAFLRDVPRLIIEHNIYGVDIDPRAAQIASLALWLRAQRAWHDAGVKAKDRPLNGRGHVVAAIAPPAERELRQQFAANLDQRDAELFEKTLQLLKGLPELGVLLQVERELPHLIRQVYVGKGTGLFAEQEQANWQQAESRLRVALTEFAQAAKSTYQGRLFAQDALQGLRMIDISRESFDVVVMNPPFGLPSANSASYINDNYAGAHNDIYCTFVARALNLCRSGYVGCITSSSFLLSPRLEAFRTNTILPNLVCVADFGLGVMDDAMVRAAAYVLGKSSSEIFLAADCKGTVRDLQAGATSSELLSRFSEVRKDWFSALPQARLLLDAPQDVRGLLAKGPYFEPIAGTAREGMKTFDNERFIRLPWEVSPSKVGAKNSWRWLSKGGEFSYFFSDIHLLLNWRDDGAELKQVNLDLNGSTAQVRQASTYWGLEGATYSRRSSGFSARALPHGCIFTSNGPAILPLNGTPPLYLLGWVNSRPIRAFTHLNAGAYDNYSTGALKKLPWKAPTARQINDLSPFVERAIVAAKIDQSRSDECSRWFSGYVIGSSLREITAGVNALKDQRAESEKQGLKKSDGVISEVYQFASLDWANEILVENQSNSEETSEVFGGVKRNITEDGEVAKDLISYFVGVAFERWQENKSLSAQESEELALPFETPPSSPPGMVHDSHGDDALQIAFALNGGAAGDLASRVSDLIGKVNVESDSLEIDVLRALGFGSLSDYLGRKFFDDHLQKYTKSKRQAPIYWQLSTSSGRYSLWLYYPRVNSQVLYTAINDLVEPKIKEIGTDVAGLRNKGSARTRDDEKQFEALQAFELELIELRDTLLKLAPTYKPNHDDGVQISAAPLWSLFRHKPWQKVLKDTWAKLEKGDYDWAHLAMNYWPERVREKCKTDKSLAIAHGLEDLYIEPETAPKKTRGRKKTGGVE
ncbi:BREX-1 system adenine-specific DNA-methyltransferase PglX [Achromobacter insolitus]|uniref:BREX-1 system adenine-specific DNA-methyltransferase PglX n=1 Tax=Achromobacter insolitus TaxID=217204 RepID=UPI000A792177|nr:BREX-1 system adenine-specific DNA-methyltransferase PglX [Achromobacter insolitus]